ncbi:MAG: DUF3783 domain-containing protein [Tissierellia bacterium]|nr:DUF3783 domain-containing protein [Tissierellia bacterium]
MQENRYMLVYNIKGERKDKFEKVSEEHGFDIRYIEDFELDLKVKDLLDGNVNLKPENYVFDKEIEEGYEFVLFVNIHDDILYNFIKDLKEVGIYIPHKALLTKMNRDWTLDFLMQENKDEHRVMTLFGRLRGLMQMGAQIYDETQDEELKQLLIDSEEYFHPREFEFEELREVYNNLAVKVNQLLEQRNKQ